MFLWEGGETEEEKITNNCAISKCVGMIIIVHICVHVNIVCNTYACLIVWLTSDSDH